MDRYLERRRRRRRTSCTRRSSRRCARATWSRCCFASARTGAGVAELLDVDRQAAAQPDRRQPAAFLNGEGDDARGRSHAEPDPAKHVLAHVFKVTIDPFVGKIGVFRVHQGTVTRDSQLFIGDGAQAVQGRPPVHAAGQGARRDRRARSRATSARVAKVDEIHFDAVLHDAADDDHIHLKPLDVPDPDVRPRDRAQEPRRRAAACRRSLHKLGRRRPVPARRAQSPRPTRPWSTASASCTCACMLERLNDTLQRSRSTRGRRNRLPRDHHRARPKATTATRSRPAAPASSARCSCASSRCRAAAGFEFVDAGQGRHDPDAVHPGGREGRAPGARDAAPSPATRCRTCASRSTTASTTRSTRKEIAFVTAGTQGLHRRGREGAGRSCSSPSSTSRSPRPSDDMGDITGDLSSRRGRISGTRAARRRRWS